MWWGAPEVNEALNAESASPQETGLFSMFMPAGVLVGPAGEWGQIHWTLSPMQKARQKVWEPWLLWLAKACPRGHMTDR